MRGKILLRKIVILSLCVGLILYPAARATGSETESLEVETEVAGLEEPEEEELEEIELEEPEKTVRSLRIFAINAGFKASDGRQSFDFIELEKTGEGELALAEYKIVYVNSAGVAQKAINFAENSLLTSTRLLLLAKTSVEGMAADENAILFNFGSAGLASTAGKVELWLGEEKQDEVCWGKFTCEHSFQKFETSEITNRSIVRCTGAECAGAFSLEKYFPELNDNRFRYLEEKPETPACAELRFSEILSYYADAVAEQFIEFYNPLDEEVELSQCQVKVGRKNLRLSGTVKGKAYYAFRDEGLAMTKNPQVAATLVLAGENGDIFNSLSYPHGQKRGTVYALFSENGEEVWRISYRATPGESNIFQEFRNCPAGSVINPLTGNCVKELDAAEKIVSCPEGKYFNPLTGRCKKIEETGTSACKEGYYRNPLTGRCKKVASSNEKALAECSEGYERNPETNRCRKIRTNTGAAYPVNPDAGNYHSTKIFVAGAALVGLLAIGVGFALFQFRHEIAAIGRRLFGALKRRRL